MVLLSHSFVVYMSCLLMLGASFPVVSAHDLVRTSNENITSVNSTVEKFPQLAQAAWRYQTATEPDSSNRPNDDHHLDPWPLHDLGHAAAPEHREEDAEDRHVETTDSGEHHSDDLYEDEEDDDDVLLGVRDAMPVNLFMNKIRAEQQQIHYGSNSH